MKSIRIFPAVLIITVLCLSLVSCRKQNASPETAGDTVYLYFLNQNKDELYPVEAVIEQEMDTNTLVDAVYASLKTPEDGASYLSALADPVVLRSYSLAEHNLVFDYESTYYSMDPVTELLMRAALVKTFTQFDDITTVEVRVDSQPLLLSDGSLTGPERGRDFVDIISSGINAYTRGTIVLYFATPDGTALRESTLNVAYQNSSPLERYVLQRLVTGPSDESQGIATLPSNTKILSVSTKDGICQVDLNDAFLKESMVLTPEVIIYSIVNSLTEVNGVTGVQISVNGSSSVLFMDEIPLSQTFVKNVNLMEGETED
ncbi:MAG: GerMN domain-containing protein [Lachnospiraceae bacterium]|nr:GerMN domain-containing protein [Lachnospiraceae bacterium]